MDVAALRPETNPPAFVPVTVPTLATGAVPALWVMPFRSTPQLFEGPANIHAAEAFPPNPTL
jgi:hypothetical protein